MRAGHVSNCWGLQEIAEKTGILMDRLRDCHILILRCPGSAQYPNLAPCLPGSTHYRARHPFLCRSRRMQNELVMQMM